MTVYQTVLAVMLGIYLINFLSSALNGMSVHWKPGTRIAIDLAFGILLLVLLLSASPAVSSYSY